MQETLSRAENRITQLSLILAKNGVSSRGAIVTPGVSKKILEALTRENAKLRSNLARFSNEYRNGVDLAAENGELHEIIMKLRGERKGSEETQASVDRHPTQRPGRSEGAKHSSDLGGDQTSKATGSKTSIL